jgi:SAM-dependent methyltransferase
VRGAESQLAMGKAQTAESIARDFDRIARIPDDPWQHNRLYHRLLWRELPARIGPVLEIGCGSGELTAALATRAEHVLGLDLSPEMLAAARERCRDLANVDLVQADALAHPLPRDHFDLVVSIATLHHLPLPPMLARARDALRPGGLLWVLDLTRDETPLELARSALAVPLNLLGRLYTSGRLRPPPEVRAAWDAHGVTDRYLSLGEVRRVAAELLPGARLRRLLFWRYALRWRKPA